MGVNVEMKYYTCWECGATYGYPDKYDGDDCPFCMKRENEAMLIEKGSQALEIMRLSHVMSGLRGTITRMKNNILKKGIARNGNQKRT